MNSACIVSANASRARFFFQENNAERLEEINDMVNDESRLTRTLTETRAEDLRSASKSRHSVGAARPQSGYEPHQTPDQHQTELFARDVANFLQQGQQEGRFREIALVASPEFLGVLRKQLDPKVASAVSLEINKDYTGFSPDQLREQIVTHQGKA